MRLPNLIAAFLLLLASAAEASYVELPVWRALWIDGAPGFSGLQRPQIPTKSPWLGYRQTYDDGKILINLGRGQVIKVPMNAEAAATTEVTRKPHRLATPLRAPSVQAVITATASVLKLQGKNAGGSRVQGEAKRAFVPEPRSLAMVLLGMGALLRCRA